MPRTRQTKPEFYEDLTLAEVPVEVRYLYQGLWCQMDKGGITEGHPRLVKQRVFPHDHYDASTVQAWCKQLVDIGRLQCCIYDAKLWLRCPRFARHQHFHRDENHRFKIPEELWAATWPDSKEHGAGTVQAPVKHRASTPIICNQISIIDNLKYVAQADANGSLPPPPSASAGAGRKRSSRSSPKPEEASVRVNRHFRARYRQRYGIEPKPWGQAENSKLAKFVRDNDEIFATEVVDQFFDSPDPHYLKFGHPLGLMITQAPKLWAERNNPNHVRVAGAAKVLEKHSERDAYNEWSGGQALRILEEEDREREAANRIEGASNGQDLQPRADARSDRALGTDAGATRVTETVAGVLARMPGVQTNADAGRSSGAGEPGAKNSHVPASKDSR